MTDMDTIRKAIISALRFPDCGHGHLSWPNADVDAILGALDRAGFVIVRKEQV